MSAAENRLRELFHGPSNVSLTPAEIYKIVEAAILNKLGCSAARTISASTLHAFVRELTFSWLLRPDAVDTSGWFAARPTTSDADWGIEAYINFFNPPPEPTVSPVSTSSYSPTPSQLSPPDDFDSDHLERLGFTPEEIDAHRRA
jgi:hypothetical protein